MSTLLLPIQALLARLSSATGVQFTLISPDTIELSADDVFKLAAFLELGCVEMANDVCLRTELTNRRVAPIVLHWTARNAPPHPKGQEPYHVAVSAPDTNGRRKVTSVGVQPDYSGRAALDIQAEKLAEAGRKSWVTRRANAAKKSRIAGLGPRKA